MIYTNRIRDCSLGWAKLLKHLGKTAADDEPIVMIYWNRT